MKLELTHQPATGLTVRPELFGGNTLYSLNSLDPDGSFVQAVDQLGVTGLRYPGGTMTEEWGAAFYDDPNTLPAHVTDAYSFIGLDAFLALYMPFVPLLKPDLIFTARDTDSGALQGYLFGKPNTDIKSFDKLRLPSLFPQWLG